MSDGTISNYQELVGGEPAWAPTITIQRPAGTTPAQAEIDAAMAHGPIGPGKKFDGGKLRPTLIPACVYHAMIEYDVTGTRGTDGDRDYILATILPTLVVNGRWLDALYATCTLLMPTGRRCWSLAGMLAILSVLEFGAVKYGPNNWQKVENAVTRYRDAAMRHLLAYHEGEEIDPESGLPHLAHMGCCLMFLLWFDLTARDPNGRLLSA